MADNPPKLMGERKRSPSAADELPLPKRSCSGIVEPEIVKKRTGYLQWDEYFMAVAFLSSQRSKDPRSQVGQPTYLSLTCRITSNVTRRVTYTHRYYTTVVQ